MKSDIHPNSKATWIPGLLGVTAPRNILARSYKNKLTALAETFGEDWWPVPFSANRDGTVFISRAESRQTEISPHFLLLHQNKKTEERQRQSGIYAFFEVCLSFTEAEYWGKVHDNKRMAMKAETEPQGSSFPLILQWEFL